MTNPQLKYTISAEDKFSDVLQKIRVNFAQMRQSLEAVLLGFRQGGFAGAWNALKNVQINGLATHGAIKLLTWVIYPATLALEALAVGGCCKHKFEHWVPQHSRRATVVWRYLDASRYEPLARRTSRRPYSHNSAAPASPSC